jgi:cellulose biosynthesis protein BcsQ
MFEIKGFKVSEISELFELTKATVSVKFKMADGVSKANNRITEIGSAAVQSYFVERGYGDLYKTTIHLSSVCTGGSAKSSTALAFLATARRMKSTSKSNINGREVSPACVLIDTDSQASASGSLLGKPRAETLPVLVDYFSGKCELTDILETIGNEVYVIPSSLNNVYLEKALSSPQMIKKSFRKLLDDLKKHFGNGFYAVIDSPPALSSSTASAIVALSELQEQGDSVHYAIPIRAMDNYAIAGARMSLNEKNEILSAFNLHDIPTTAFITFFNRSGKSSVQVLKQVLDDDLLKDVVSNTVIRWSAEFSKANLKGSSIYSGKKTSASEDYQSLFLELLGFEKKMTGNA